MEPKKFENIEVENYEGKETHIVFVVDKSSSMSSIRNDVIQAFNDQVKIIKEKEKNPKSTVSLVTFSGPSQMNLVYDARKITDLVELTTEDYLPEGMTALVDAVLFGINKLGDRIPALMPTATDEQKAQIKKDEVAVLFLVLTDGCENASIKTPDDLKEWQESLTNSGFWTFTYLINEVGSAKMSAFLASVGTQSGNVATFNTSAKGVRLASGMSGQSIGSYYAGREQGRTQTASFFNPEEEPDVAGETKTDDES